MPSLASALHRNNTVVSTSTPSCQMSVFCVLMQVEVWEDSITIWWIIPSCALCRSQVGNPLCISPIIQSGSPTSPSASSTIRHRSCSLSSTLPITFHRTIQVTGYFNVCMYVCVWLNIITSVVMCMPWLQSDREINQRRPGGLVGCSSKESESDRISTRSLPPWCVVSRTDR